MGVERANWRALDGRMMSAINAKGGPGKFQTWAAYDYAQRGHLRHRPLRQRRHQHDLRRRRRAAHRQDPGRRAVRLLRVQGRLRQRQRRLQAARTDAHVLRRLRRGTVVRRRHARRRLARLLARRATSGWAPPRATRAATPTATTTSRACWAGTGSATRTGTTARSRKLTWEKVVVRQFSENGNDSTALTFGQQKVDTFLSSLGWQVTGNLSGFRPFARATWEYNFDGDTRQVSAKSNSLNGTYVVPGLRAGRQLVAVRSRRQPRVRRRDGLPLRQRVGRQGRRRLLGADARYSRAAVARAHAQGQGPPTAALVVGGALGLTMRAAHSVARNCASARRPPIARLPYHDVHSPSIRHAGLLQRCASASASRCAERVGLGRDQDAVGVAPCRIVVVERGIALRRAPPAPHPSPRARAWRPRRFAGRPSSTARAR